MIFVRVKDQFVTDELPDLENACAYDVDTWFKYLKRKYSKTIIVIDYKPGKYLVYFTGGDTSSITDRQLILATEEGMLNVG